ncbi:MAG TPA: DnaJ domain-containing protein [Polyangia bacterium]|nr:DnaJ domain-containing protein [Polyangia bacterium]
MPGTPDDLYAVLGVARAATGAEIRRAYRRLALLHHPDRAGPAGAPIFARLAEAYRMLSDPTARTAYDAHLFERERAFAAAPGQADGRAWSVQSVGWSASVKRPVPNLVPRLSGPLEALVAAGAARLDPDGVLELSVTATEAARGGAAVVEMAMAILCPTCGGVAGPRVWCRRCEHAGRVTETVAVEVRFPAETRDGLVVTATLRQAGVVSQRARLRISR